VVFSGCAAWLRPLRRLALGEHSLVLRVYDSKMLFHDSSIIVEVCDCKGDDVTCSSGVYAANISTLSIYVLAAILCFLGKQIAHKYGFTNKKNVNSMYSTPSFVLEMRAGEIIASAYIFSFSLRLQTEVVNICMDLTGNLIHFIDLCFLNLIFLDNRQFIGVKHRIFGL